MKRKPQPVIFRRYPLTLIASAIILTQIILIVLSLLND